MANGKSVQGAHYILVGSLDFVELPSHDRLEIHHFFVELLSLLHTIVYSQNILHDLLADQLFHDFMPDIVVVYDVGH